METKKLRLRIWNDSNAECPFEAWDCEPAVMALYDRWVKDYSKGDIFDTIQDKLSDKVIIEKKELLLEALDLEHYDYSDVEPDELEEQVINDIREELYSVREDLDILSKVLDVVEVPNMIHDSRGYSQGDYSKVLIVLTPKFFKDTGCDPTKADEILKGTAKLYDDWAWGDVYGFTVERRIDFKKVDEDGTEEDCYEWEFEDSCGGFYGSDFKTNGMLDHLPEELHEAAINFDYKDIEYR